MTGIYGVGVAAVGVPASARGWWVTPSLSQTVFNLHFPQLPSEAETGEENTEIQFNVGQLQEENLKMISLFSGLFWVFLNLYLVWGNTPISLLTSQPTVSNFATWFGDLELT